MLELVTLDGTCARALLAPCPLESGTLDAIGGDSQRP